MTTINSQSVGSSTIIVGQDDAVGTNTAPVSTSISVAVDYTSQLNSIAQSASNISIAITSIANNIATITSLGSGKGIHTIGPYDWAGLAAIYKLMIEQGKALDTTLNANASVQASALAAFSTYLTKIENLPTNY
jgi:hypothetical protein